MKTPKKETKEVINEAVKKVTGKTVDELKAQIEANEIEIDKEFAKEYEELCAKFKRRAVPNPQLQIQRLK
jgi:predicted  nucleic acid-binding Zn-ribbon protein